jgi:cytoskeleton protein RodZ
MDSIGDMLRRTRNKLGLTLDDVAARTRISRKYLDAIEQGDRSVIPGGFFYKSFVRQYADMLSTGDSDLADEIEEMLASEQSPAPVVHHDPLLKAVSPEPVQESAPASWNPSISTYALLLVLALIGSTGLYMWWHRAQQAQAAADLARPTEPVREQPQTAPAAPATPAAPAAVTRTPANPENKIALDISANALTWFSLTADGKSLFSGTLEPGESKTFAARENARLRTGNAGGIDVKFNGKPLGPLGPKAQIRTVIFTPSDFKIVKPNPDEDEG